MPTPEGAVKRKITAVLKSTPGVYYYMPVPSGYGNTSLDYIGCYMGRFFAIEAKAPTKKPTDRQLNTIKDMQRAFARVFVIDGDLTELKHWLKSNEA